MIFKCPECGEKSEREIYDKLCWLCDKCRSIFEVNSKGKIIPLLLTREDHGARFTSMESGNMCTGFGGKGGEV